MKTLFQSVLTLRLWKASTRFRPYRNRKDCCPHWFPYRIVIAARADSRICTWNSISKRIEIKGVKFVCCAILRCKGERINSIGNHVLANALSRKLKNFTQPKKILKKNIAGVVFATVGFRFIFPSSIVCRSRLPWNEKIIAPAVPPLREES